MMMVLLIVTGVICR